MTDIVDAVDVEEEHPSRGSISLYLLALGTPIGTLALLVWLWMATIPDYRVVDRTYVSYGPTMTSFRIWRMECVSLEHQREWDALLEELWSTRHAELRGRP